MLMPETGTGKAGQTAAQDQTDAETVLLPYLIPDCVNPLTTYLLANMKIIRTGTTDTRVDAIIRPGFV